MGRAIREKQAKLQEQETAIQARLTAHNHQKIKKVKWEIQPVLENTLNPFKEFFFRNPSDFVLKTKSSNSDKQLKELVRFVFNRYQVPNFLYSVWSKEEQGRRIVGPSIDFKKWYICVASGGSLYKEHAKRFLTKKEVHAFLQCPHDLTPKEVVIYAVAKVACENEGVALRLARSKIKEKTVHLDDFWLNVVRFFCTHTPQSINDVNDLVDYLQFKKEENNKFSINGMGFTLVSLQKKMTDWHYDLRRMKAIGDARWEGVAIPDSEYTNKDRDGNTITWKFIQIKTAKDLQTEGNQQRHCVYGYKDQCVRGSISIWSLSTISKTGALNKKLTLELNNAGYIVQARGLANRSARPEERHIMSIWCKEHYLYKSFY